MQEARNALKFKRMLRAANSNLPRAIQMLLAQRAATFATYRHTGQFVSHELENWLNKLALDHFNSGRVLATGNETSTLHIMSKAYSTGGHTKVVERWIDAATDNQRHSLVLTRGGFVPDKIVREVDRRGGQIYKLGKLTSLHRRAKELREVSSSYSHVVLHVHMDDILPMLAFSQSSSWQRIIHFNHADHRFWVGASLPDRVIEMRTWGKALSIATRGLAFTEVIGIPMPPIARKLDPSLSKAIARETLNIPSDAEVLLTIGASRKYARGPKTNFPLVMRKLLENQPKRRLICVGQERAQNSDWRSLEKDFPGQVLFVSPVAREVLESYISAADVGLDSFPMSGGTAVLDMFTLGLPVYSLKCETGHFDPVLVSGFYCLTEEELVAKVNKSLSSVPGAQNHEIQKVLDSCSKSFGRETWTNVLDESLVSSFQNLIDSAPLTEAEITDLNGYLVGSTPLVAKLFF